MIVQAEVTIKAPIPSVWAAMTGIEKLGETIRGVQEIEIIERPTDGLVGLRWRETRILFGRPAAVEKWITEAKENSFYTTQAEEGGFVFLTTHRLSRESESTILTGIHETIPQGFTSRIKALPLVFFKGAIKKMILEDLNDIKSAIEIRNE